MLEYLLGVSSKKAAAGQKNFLVASYSVLTLTDTFVVPGGVTKICAVVVGRGGASYNGVAGGGGGLSWRNDIPVVPGEILSVVMNSTYTQIARGDEILCTARAASTESGALGGKNAHTINDGGGNGGNGGKRPGGRAGGGGAGGYTSNGGRGGSYDTGPTTNSLDGGNGGFYNASLNKAGGGYGVSILGAGNTGANGLPLGSTYLPGLDVAGYDDHNTPSGGGGRWGGGAATFGAATEIKGAPGAARIIWGAGRAYPKTRTEDE